MNQLNRIQSQSNSTHPPPQYVLLQKGKAPASSAQTVLKPCPRSTRHCRYRLILSLLWWPTQQHVPISEAAADRQADPRGKPRTHHSQPAAAEDFISVSYLLCSLTSPPTGTSLQINKPQKHTSINNWLWGELELLGMAVGG